VVKANTHLSSERKSVADWRHYKGLVGITQRRIKQVVEPVLVMEAFFGKFVDFSSIEPNK
jgi:hypothetical protein